MAKRTKQRIYWRERGGARRAYADFRDYRDVGGGWEALAPPGEKQATTDADLAAQLIGERLKELRAKREKRERGEAHEPASAVRLQAYAREHLIQKARIGKYADRWLACAQLYLERACAFFGADRPLAAIGAPDVQRWVQALQQQPSCRRAGRLTGGTIRHHLNSLSNLYQRAQSEALVPLGFNPVAALMDKPVADPEEARWLEVHEAALVLEAARQVRPAPAHPSTAFAFPLVATFLLTGGRRAEVLGLEVGDVSFDRKTVTFRRNASRRRLKTRPSRRVIPLWPQLEEILRPYVFNPERPPTRLLFPRFVSGQEAMVTDFRKLLDAVAIAAGFSEPVLDADGKPALDAKERPRVRGTLTSKMFRHTYCAARLQTLDRGAPVSQYTVSREMGHGSGDMVEQVYSHLGTVRHRAEVVEYRAEQHAEVLGDRLATLRRPAPKSGTTVSVLT